MIELIQRAKKFSERTAIVSNETSYTYEHLLRKSQNVSANLLNGKNDLNEARITYLVPSSFNYTALQWGIWQAGGIAVPLCVLHPLPSIQYVLEDTQAKIVIVHQDYFEFLKPLEKAIGITVVPLEAILKENTCELSDIDVNRRAMILYTSGTTSKPKGNA